MQSLHGKTTLVFSSVVGQCFTEGSSCSHVKGLLQTFILCFLGALDCGSVIPLIYNNVACPAQLFELKAKLTGWSGF